MLLKVNCEKRNTCQSPRPGVLASIDRSPLARAVPAVRQFGPRAVLPPLAPSFPPRRESRFSGGSPCPFPAPPRRGGGWALNTCCWWGAWLRKVPKCQSLIVRRDVDFLWAGLFGGDSPPVNVMSPFFLLLWVRTFLFQLLPLELCPSVLKPHFYLREQRHRPSVPRLPGPRDGARSSAPCPHRALPAPYPARTVPCPLRALPAPCPARTVPCLLRTLPAPCPACSMSWPHRALAAPCPACSVPCRYHVLPTPSAARTVPCPGV